MLRRPSTSRNDALPPQQQRRRRRVATVQRRPGLARRLHLTQRRRWQSISHRLCQLISIYKPALKVRRSNKWTQLACDLICFPQNLLTASEAACCSYGDCRPTQQINAALKHQDMMHSAVEWRRRRRRGQALLILGSRDAFAAFGWRRHFKLSKI